MDYFLEKQIKEQRERIRLEREESRKQKEKLMLKLQEVKKELNNLK